MEIFKRNMETFRDEFEDDDFYDELRRQILILTAEDEDYVQKSNEIKNSNRVEMKFPYQFYWYGDKEDNNNSEVPKWLLDLWRKENRNEVFNGTGVFIPHIVKSRRRNKSRRKNTERGKTCKPVATVNY